MLLSKETATSLRVSPIIIALILSGLVIHAQESTPAPGTVGMPWTGAPGIRETTAQFMAREARSGTQRQRVVRYWEVI